MYIAPLPALPLNNAAALPITPPPPPPNIPLTQPNNPPKPSSTSSIKPPPTIPPRTQQSRSVAASASVPPQPQLPYRPQMAICANGAIDLSAEPATSHPAPLLDALDALDVPVWDAESSTPVERPSRCTVLDALAPAPLAPEPKRHRPDPQNQVFVVPSTAAALHLASTFSHTPASASASGSAPASASASLSPTRSPTRSTSPRPAASAAVTGSNSNATHRPSTVAKQRPKQYKRPTASKFCHVCGRKSHNVDVAVCSKIEDGLCRKVVCEFCFDKYGWDRTVLDDVKRAKEQAKNGGEVQPLKGRKRRWQCPHCLGICVAKAQCNTYGKTNYKRHLKLRSRRTDKGAGPE